MMHGSTKLKYVKIVDSEVLSGHFTRHGLHMNTAGKERMAQRITDYFRKPLLGRKKTPPIILKWRQDLIDSGQDVPEAQEKVTYSRTSWLERKQPATIGNNFLLTADLMTRV